MKVEEDGNMSAYELQREALIARNRARMDALDIPELSHAKKTQSKSSSSKAQHAKRLNTEAPRRSLRVAGHAADPMEVMSERRGGVITTTLSSDQVKRIELPLGDVNFWKLPTCDEEEDGSFLNWLKRQGREMAARQAPLEPPSSPASASPSRRAMSIGAGGDSFSEPSSPPASALPSKRASRNGSSISASLEPSAPPASAPLSRRVTRSGGATPLPAAAASRARPRSRFEPESKEAAPSSSQPAYSWLSKLQLRQRDVVKVLPGACTHVAFYPSAEHLLIAAGDKYGGVSVWDVDRITKKDAHEGSLADLGPASTTANGEARVILSPAASAQTTASPAASAQLTPSVSRGGSAGAANPPEPCTLPLGYHKQYISALFWRDGGLVTASYDGTVRVFDPESEKVWLAFRTEEHDLSCAGPLPLRGPAPMLVGAPGGAVALLDWRAGRGAQPDGRAFHTLHSRKVNTIQAHPKDPNLFLTASTDTFVRVWDLRKLPALAGLPLKSHRGATKLSTCIAEGQHLQGCQAALFAPQGPCFIASTSFDNTVSVWDAGQLGGAKLAKMHSHAHNNNTGRWVLPFRAVWAPDGSAIAIGGMHRTVDILDPTTPLAKKKEAHEQLSAEAMTAIPSRNAFHPNLPVLAAATNSGRLHIYR